jgi:hypothetical protein
MYGGKQTDYLGGFFTEILLGRDIRAGGQG